MHDAAARLEHLVARAFSPDGWLVRAGFRHLPQQEEYARHVAAWLTGPPDKPAGLIEASTGIGKSLGYLIPALCWSALTGRRIAVSTFTIQLQRQLLQGDLDTAQRFVQDAGFAPLAIGHFLGRANYLNPRRIDALRAKAPSHSAEKILEQLSRWCKSGEDGTLQGFVEMHGDLPQDVSVRDICLHASDSDDDAPAFVAQRAAVPEANIIVTSHAVMILNASTRSRVAQANARDILPVLDAVIFDEADRLESAAGFLQKRIPLSHLRTLIEKLLAMHTAQATTQSLKLLLLLLKIIGNLDEHLQQLETADSARPLLVSQFDAKTRASISRLAKTLQRLLAHWRVAKFEPAGGEMLDELETIAAWLDRFAAPQSEANQYCGVIWSPVQHLPSLYEYRLDPQSILTRDMRQPREGLPVLRKLFTSATLSDANASHALRFKGFWSALRVKSSAVCCETSCAPKHFGEMRFVLAAADAPEPFGGDANRSDANTFALSDDWLVYCARLLATVAENGAALVLTSSYEETEKLSRVLLVPHIAHRRGTKLNALIAEFRQQRTLLLTPAAWEGVSLRREDGTQLFRELVITRLPFARTSDEELAALRVSARQRDGSGLAPESIAFARRANDAKRKLHQGIGRGIRSAFDSCRVWIADPRFPHPDKVSVFSSLRSAIPERFWDRYANADYFSQAGSLQSCRENAAHTQDDIVMRYL